MAAKKLVAALRTGTFKDSNGKEHTFDVGRLDAIAAAYNPQFHEAPEVIGHPKDNAPAYGWIEAVKREGDILYAKMKGLIPEFVEMLKTGMFKKRSISLYPDGTLRHVGFLGAMPPAVKGLPDFAFGDSAGMTIEFEENNSPQNNRKKEEGTMSFWERLKKRLADAGVNFSELFGSETPPTLYTEADIKTKIDEAVASAVKARETEFSEKVASLDEQRKKKEAELKAREDVIKMQEGHVKKKAVASFCEDLKKKGILIPAMEKLGMGVTEFMQQIASIETPIEFGEEGKKEKQTPLEFMQAFLGSLPKAIEFGEVATKDSTGIKIEDSVVSGIASASPKEGGK